ncbi:Serine/threonine protein kinase [Handroanthus impetiginosus]|uniref:Serine/threonine protein kinase n=1 Tax=Handroanthus impetiginosus TaxID=429701 RepID=A0A2G9G2F9_9LAMI|nr:Serine/threonine protein kinase [Handroanthus impetiginosus]
MAPCIVLEDELRTFKNAFTVNLRDDIVFVVKRLRRGNIARSLFEEGMKAIGSIEHENVNRVYLGWETRIQIAVGATKGLVHIHTQRNVKLLHGSIKASNIFLNPQRYGCLADINIFATSEISSYQEPAALTTKELSQKSNAYSFVILLTKLLSGKSPLHFSAWNALRIAGDEWTALVFDKGLLKDPVVKQGMRDMLAVALSCLDKKAEERPNMSHVDKEWEFMHTKLAA